MGIVNHRPMDHSKPEWRNAMDRGENLTESAKKDMLFDLEANRKETGKIIEEIGTGINQGWKDIQIETGNIITDVKSSIKAEKEALEKAAVDSYENYKKQFNDGVKNLKNEAERIKDNWKKEAENAKDSLMKVKKDLESLDWKKLGESVQNGFVKFVKTNLKDTLDIDVDNTGVPIVRQIYNAAGKAIINAINKNFPAPPAKHWAVPTHGLFAQIGDVNMYDKTGCILEYTEICDYINNMFPVRMLVVEAPINVVQKILSSKKKEINGQKYAYDMLLSCRPLTDDVFPQIPIFCGNFVAILKDNDNIVNISEVISKNTNLQQNDLISAQKVKLTFYITTEKEIEFQASPMINYVLDNPKPMEIISRSYELANPKGKILISQLENDVDMGKIVIPHMSFLDLVKFIDKEIGLYNTKYMEFYENGLYYLLNTNNIDKIGVSCPPKESKIELFINRHKDGRSYPKFIQYRKADNNTYQVSVDVSEVSVEIQNDSVWNDNTLFIKPQGYRNYYNNPMSHHTHTIRKITGAAPLKKDNTKAVEIITFDMIGFPINNVSPLSRVFTLDSSDKARIYRVCYKEIVISSHTSTKTRIKAFRRQQN